jgi:hypothetical protein
MDPPTNCDFEGPNGFLKLLDSYSKGGTKSSSLTRSRSSKGGKKSRKNLRMKGGNKEKVKFAVKAFIYLIFALLSFGGCVEMYTNREFLLNVAEKVGITLEAFILIISAVVTVVKTDYKKDSLTKIPFDYVRGVVAGHHVVGKQLIDVVVFFVTSKNQLNKYLDGKIDKALDDDDNPTAITDETVFEQSTALTAAGDVIEKGITNIKGVVDYFKGKSKDASESNALVSNNNIYSELPTSRYTDSIISRRKSARQLEKNAREVERLNEELKEYFDKGRR